MIALQRGSVNNVLTKSELVVLPSLCYLNVRDLCAATLRVLGNDAQKIILLLIIARI